MEYDPAFPTGDNVKKKKKQKKDVSAIPLPSAFPSLSEIPMPMVPNEEIELPPEPAPVPIVPMMPVIPMAPASPTTPPTSMAMALEPKAMGPQPVKFQMKVTPKPLSSSDSGETSKPLTSSLPSLSSRSALKVGNSLVKRMRAGVLPTGVLSGRKKPSAEESGTVPVPPVPKEVERFVPPTMNTSVNIDPSLTLTSDMLDAAKRAISQINSALLGVPNTFDGSSITVGGTPAGATLASGLPADAPSSSSPPPSLPPPPPTASSRPEGVPPSTRRSPSATKRRRSRSMSPRSPRASKQKKARRHSRSSSPRTSGSRSRSGGGGGRRNRRRRRRRSRSPRRRRGRGRSASRHRAKGRRAPRRRRPGMKDRSRSPPQSRRGRSRSLRKALSPSGSSSSSSSSSDSASSHHSSGKASDDCANKAELVRERRTRNVDMEEEEREALKRKGRGSEEKERNLTKEKSKSEKLDEEKDQRHGHKHLRESKDEVETKYKDRREPERNSDKERPKESEKKSDRETVKDNEKDEKERPSSKEVGRRDRERRLSGKDNGKKTKEKSVRDVEKREKERPSARDNGREKEKHGSKDHEREKEKLGRRSVERREKDRVKDEDRRGKPNSKEREGKGCPKDLVKDDEKREKGRHLTRESKKSSEKDRLKEVDRRFDKERDRSIDRDGYPPSKEPIRVTEKDGARKEGEKERRLEKDHDRTSEKNKEREKSRSGRKDMDKNERERSPTKDKMRSRSGERNRSDKRSKEDYFSGHDRSKRSRSRGNDKVRDTKEKRTSSKDQRHKLFDDEAEVKAHAIRRSDHQKRDVKKEEYNGKGRHSHSSGGHHGERVTANPVVLLHLKEEIDEEDSEGNSQPQESSGKQLKHEALANRPADGGKEKANDARKAVVNADPRGSRSPHRKDKSDLRPNVEHRHEEKSCDRNRGEARDEKKTINNETFAHVKEEPRSPERSRDRRDSRRQHDEERTKTSGKDSRGRHDSAWHEKSSEVKRETSGGQKRNTVLDEAPGAKRRSGTVDHHKTRSPDRGRRDDKGERLREKSRRRGSMSPDPKRRESSSSGYKTLKEEAEERAQRRKEEDRREKRRGEVCEDSQRRKERHRSHSHSPPGERPRAPRAHQSAGSRATSGAERERERERERSGDHRREHGRGTRDKAGRRSPQHAEHREDASPGRCRRRSISRSPPLISHRHRQDSEITKEGEEEEGKKEDEAVKKPGEKQYQQSSEFMEILKKFDDFFTALSSMSTSRPEADSKKRDPAGTPCSYEPPGERGSESGRPRTPIEPRSPKRPKTCRERGRHRRRKASSSSSAMSVSGGSSPGVSPEVRKTLSNPTQPLPATGFSPASVQPAWPSALSASATVEGRLPTVSAASTDYSVPTDVSTPYNGALNFPVSQQQQWPFLPETSAFDASSSTHHTPYPTPQAPFGHEVFDITRFPTTSISNQEYQQFFYQQAQQQHHQQPQQSQPLPLFPLQPSIFEPQQQQLSQQPPQMWHPSQPGFQTPYPVSLVPTDFSCLMGHGEATAQRLPMPSMRKAAWAPQFAATQQHQSLHQLQLHDQTQVLAMTQELERPLRRSTQETVSNGSDVYKDTFLEEPLRIATETTSLTSGVPSKPSMTPTPGGPATPRSNGIDGDGRQEEGEDEDEEEEEEEEEEEGSVCAEEGGGGSRGQGSELEVELGEGDHPSLAPDDLSSIGDKELEMTAKDDGDEESWNDRSHHRGPRTPSLDDLYPDAPRPTYEHIDENEYKSRSLMRSRSKLETNRWVCDCTVPNPDEAAQGIKPCGDDCINRVLNIECGPRCPIAELCTNRQFQEKRIAPVEPFYAGPDKGWGLRARERIVPGTFVIEYVGEVIDFREFKRRIVAYEREGHAHHYFMALEADTFADAGTKGNWARFVNHSCEPNAETQKWNVLGQIRVGFFAKRRIEKGEEITIDYQFVQFGRTEQKCYCGTPSCTGIMGSTSKQLQEKVRVKDTRHVERRLAKLLSMDVLKNADDVQMLLKVLVQEYLLRDARYDLLGLVLRTESEACLKMFRQYNGLELLASYMRDSDVSDWTMKLRLLEVLDKIPVLEQKQLRSGTNLFSIVRQWEVDPRFCRQRANLLTSQSSSSGGGGGGGSGGGGSGGGSGKGGDSVVPSPATTATTNEDGDAADGQEVVAPGVDLETGEKTGPESDLDQQQVEQIRELAQRLLAKWELLPDEIYRIPKVERHETEQLLQPSSGSAATSSRQSGVSHRSSVLSSSQSRAPLVSWGLEKKRPNSPPSRPNEGLPKLGPGGGLGSGTPRLPKDEFRRLFEAYVRFEEEQKKLSEEQKKLSEQRKQHEIDLSKIHDPSLQDAVEKIRQLLSRTLLHAIEQLKRGMQPQLVLPPDLTEVAQDEKVQRLLGELQHVEMSQLLTLLSGCDGPAEGSILAGERGSAFALSLSGPGIPGPEEQLPPNWKWARDTDGRLYFYHVLTKKTQWEAPLYPWDAGEEDPEAYCYNNAYLYQVTHEEIAAMNVRIQRLLKDKAKAEKAERKKLAKQARKDHNWEEKHRARFHKQMYKIVASHLHKYRSPDVKIGRITSSTDLKYLGKKLALTILHKEMKQVRTTEDLEVNANVTAKAIGYVDKYMSGRGAFYMRRSAGANRRISSAASPSQRSGGSKQFRCEEESSRPQQHLHKACQPCCGGEELLRYSEEEPSLGAKEDEDKEELEVMNSPLASATMAEEELKELDVLL